MRLAIWMTLLMVAMFIAGAATMYWVRDRVYWDSIAGMHANALGNFASIADAVLDDNKDEALRIVRDNIQSREEVFRAMQDHHPKAFQDNLYMLQVVRRQLAYSGDPILSKRFAWATSPIDLARSEFDTNIVQAAALAPALDIAVGLNGFRPLSELHGKVVLLDFWTTSCAPCVAGMPKLQALEDELADRGFVVQTIHGAGKTEPTLAEFAAKRRITLPIGIDAGATFSKYGVHALPTKVLIDRSGRVVWAPDPLASENVAMSEDAELSFLRTRILEALERE